MEKKTTPGNPERRWMPQSRNPGSLGERSSADPALNYVDRRTRMDRRVLYDRRELIRFEVDRRTGDARRLDTDPWEFP